MYGTEVVKVVVLSILEVCEGRIGGTLSAGLDGLGLAGAEGKATFIYVVQTILVVGAGSCFNDEDRALLSIEQ